MKKHQFEEITAALSIIITLLAYQFEINWLFWIYLLKSLFDTYCAIKESYKPAKKSALKKQKT